MLGVLGALCLIAGLMPTPSMAQAQDEPDLPVPELIVIPPAEQHPHTAGPPIEPAPFEPINPIVIPLMTNDQQLYPVIIRLRTQVSYQPEGRLSETAAIMGQRADIQRSQDNLLQRVQRANARVENLRPYQTIPYMALHVDAAGLALLQNDPDVLSIVEDQVRELYTHYSNPVVGAPTAWGQGLRGEGYAVAILDTGVSSGHPMFAGGKVVQEACYGTNSGSTFISACPGGQTEVIGPGAAAPANCAGCYHGTHVAGIAAGDGGDVSGFIGEPGPIPVEGAAPGASIIAVNVFSISISGNRPGAFDSDVLAGLEYVYRLATDGPDGIPGTGDEMNIAAANMSLGGGRSSGVCDGASDPGYVAIANQLASRNIATIAATGNDGYKDSVGFPACYSNIIAVGAVTVAASDPTGGLAGSDLTVAAFSNDNALVDLYAPGYFVTSGVPVGTGPSGSDYRRLSGTSMASPYIAGGWAVMRQRFPNATPSQILRQMQLSGVPITDNGQVTAYGNSTGSGFTHSLMQLDKAINLLEPVLLSPLTITLDLRPAFYWQNMPLTDKYDIAVYEMETDTLVAVATDFAGCGAEQCAVAAGVNLVNNQRYYWTVQGKNNNGLVSPIARLEFTVRSASPQGDIITDTPDFVFERSANTDLALYQLEVIDRDNGNAVLFSGAFATSDVCDIAICIINPQVNLAQVIGNKNLAWRYRGFNNATQTHENWTDYKDFRVIPPTITAPTGTITNANGLPIYRVNRLSDGENSADWYRFYVLDANTDAFVADEWVNITQGNCDATTCELTPQTLLYDGDYVVYVNAYTTGLGRSSWSAGRRFTLDAPAPRTNYLELTGIYDLRLPGILLPQRLTTINGLTTTFMDCDSTGGQPLCSRARPYFHITYNQGGFSGEWVEIVLYEPASQEVPYQAWINVRNPQGQDNVICDPAPLTPTTVPQPASCIVQSPDYLPNGQYQWYVRSWGAGGPSMGGIAGYTQPGSATEGDPNNIANFSIGLPGEPVTGLTATLSARSKGLTPTYIAGEITFSWQPALSAEWYQISIINSSNESIHNQWYQLNRDILCTERCEIVLDDVYFTNGSYQWRVHYWNGVISQPSAINNFTLRLDAPLLPPVADLQVYLNETIAGQTRPTYAWPNMPNATWYRLLVERGDGTQVFETYYRALHICDTNGCAILPENDLTDGPYRWFVQPWGPAGFGGTLGPANFNASSQATGQAIQIAPANITLTTSVPTFSWEVATNASWYQLFVYDTDSSTVALDDWFYLPQSACTRLVEGRAVCDVAPGVKMPNSANYIWFIRAYGPAGLGEWSSLFGQFGLRFGINAPLSRIPVLYAPINEAVVPVNPVFEWEAVGAEYYRLEIRDAVGNVFWSEWYPAAQVPCTNQLCRLSIDPERLFSGRYFWTISTWATSNGTAIRSSEQAVFIRL